MEMRKKSAIVGRPTKDDGDVSSAEAWISEGLDRPLKEEISDEPAQLKLRVTKGKVAEIDSLIGKRRVKISRHVWLMEAIEEKIARESEGT